MKFGKITGVVFLAVGAVGIAAGTAYAEPGAARQPAAVVHNDATSGVDNGIHYRTTVSLATKAITATVDAGRFAVAADGSSVVLKSDTGATLDRIALGSDIAGHVYTASEQISRDGRTLTLTPQVSGREIGRLENIDSFGFLMNEVERNIVGVAIGGILGGFLGSLLGVGLLSIITGPLGGLIGAVAGGYLEGGQQFLNAVEAVASGRP
jgi:hypothetical protein